VSGSSLCFQNEKAVSIETGKPKQNMSKEKSSRKKWREN
jgi:hypothetical protein